MEGMVSNLVRSYEKGGLTRRQPIAGLAALTATTQTALASHAAPGSLITSGADAPLRSSTAVTVNHVGINVSDLHRPVALYSGIFGLAVLVQGDDVAVLGFRSGDPSTTLVLRTSQKPELNHFLFGINHFDAEALAAYLKGNGLESRTDVSSFHIKDPDGIDVQVDDQALKPSATVLLPHR
jgi:catechol 2,3-dioxygenase-like lactoylglutathione lyase family enzyme